MYFRFAVYVCLRCTVCVFQVYCLWVFEVYCLCISGVLSVCLRCTVCVFQVYCLWVFEVYCLCISGVLGGPYPGRCVCRRCVQTSHQPLPELFVHGGRRAENA